MDKIYAPVLIPTLCRSKHFIRCVESLKKNGWAKYTDIYVALDYPPNEKYESGYTEICKYLNEEDFSVFASFNVIKRDYNFGSVKNMRDLRNSVEGKYPYFIRTDDDAEFSVNFLEYMNKCLWQFENDKNCLGIMGFCYPLDWKVENDSNIFKMNYMCYMWGTAFYFDKYNLVRNDLENCYLKKVFKKSILNGKSKKLLTVRYEDFVSEGTLKHPLLECASDVGIGTYMPIQGSLFMISPTISKVRNWGFDGSGVYCPKTEINKKKLTTQNFDYTNQAIDNSSTFNIKLDNNENYELNRRVLNKFEKRSILILIKTKLKLVTYLLFGEVFFQRIQKLGEKNEQ